MNPSFIVPKIQQKKVVKKTTKQTEIKKESLKVEQSLSDSLKMDTTLKVLNKQQALIDSILLEKKKK